MVSILHQAEGLDGLRLVVLDELEVVLGEIGDRVAAAIGDDDVDAHEVDAGAEDRLLGAAARRPAAPAAGVAGGAGVCGAGLRRGRLRRGRLGRLGLRRRRGDATAPAMARQRRARSSTASTASGTSGSRT